MNRFYLHSPLAIRNFALSNESDTRTSSRNIYIGCVRLVSEGS